MTKKKETPKVADARDDAHDDATMTSTANSPENSTVANDHGKAQGRPQDGETAPEGGPAAEPEAGAENAERIAELEDETASLKDQLLRAVAETENVRNRARRDREDGLKYASTSLVRDLLGVVDNLQRALSSIPDETTQENDQLKTLVTGVRMTEQEILSVFERHHIKVLNPLNEPFDPHQHQAVFEIPDPDKASGTVLQVLQAGYCLHDRLLRPASVGVAKAAPQDNKANSAPGAQVDTKV